MMIPWAPIKRIEVNKDQTEMRLTSIVAGSQGSEAFLTSCIPNLELDHVIFMFDILKFEVNSNCIEKVLVERVLCIS